jgi:hypothetical protein
MPSHVKMANHAMQSFLSHFLNVIQLVFYAAAAEALSAIQGEVEELSLAAEGDYRCV